MMNLIPTLLRIVITGHAKTIYCYLGMGKSGHSYNTHIHHYLQLHRGNGYKKDCNGVNNYDNDSLESMVTINFIASLHRYDFGD